jgi:hypothetical protein
VSVQDEIDRAAMFGEKLEDLVVKRDSIKIDNAPDRERLLLAYWSLILDYDKGVLTLMQARYYGGAFALIRPVVEALVRAHVVLMSSDDVVRAIKDDNYTTNFQTVGKEIDEGFALHGFFDAFLNGARGGMQSFTHSGFAQLGRRFQDADLVAHYEDGEITEVIRTTSAAVFMVTNLVCKHFRFVEEGKKAEGLFIEWGLGNKGGAKSKALIDTEPR